MKNKDLRTDTFSHINYIFALGKKSRQKKAEIDFLSNSNKDNRNYTIQDLTTIILHILIPTKRTTNKN